jgi:hypothetical protein
LYVCIDILFYRYCALAFERLNIQPPTLPELWSRGQRDLDQWCRVVIVYTLRLILAPLVETVILLDRMLFVLEHGMILFTLKFQSEYFVFKVSSTSL